MQSTLHLMAQDFLKGVIIMRHHKLVNIESKPCSILRWVKCVVEIISRLRSANYALHTECIQKEWVLIVTHSSVHLVIKLQNMLFFYSPSWIAIMTICYSNNRYCNMDIFKSYSTYIFDIISSDANQQWIVILLMWWDSNIFIQRLNK